MKVYTIPVIEGKTTGEVKVQILPDTTVVISLDHNALNVTVDGKRKFVEPALVKSAHKAGEPFTGRVYKDHIAQYPAQGLEYAGELRPPEPDEWFLTEVEDIALMNHSGKAWYAPREILRPRTIRRNAKPVVKESTSKYKVGDVVELKGEDGLPDGKYKILDQRLPKKGEMIIGDMEDGLIAVISKVDYRYFKAFITAPMPSTGWYDFAVEGVKCRAYERVDSRIIKWNGGDDLYYVWIKGMSVFGDIILDAVDACLKRECGEGIKVVPFAVSMGVYTAPEE